MVFGQRTGSKPKQVQGQGASWAIQLFCDPRSMSKLALTTRFSTLANITDS